jgi:hypothetical protein
MMHAFRFNRSITVGITTLALGLITTAGMAVAEGESAMTCTNPASGATWQIRVDYVRKMVDSNPARISDAEITWRDASDGGNYTLDRKSGNLTVVIASSTGGYFLHDVCKLDR